MRDPWDNAGDPLEALRDGDPRPFERLVRERTPAFCGFFRRLGATPFEAEDLTQDVFMKLYRSSARYRPQGSVRAYCLRVAHNAWVDHRRRAGVRPREASGDPQAVEPAPGGGAGGTGREEEPVSSRAGPVEVLEARDRSLRLARAIGTLPAAQGEVFELAVVQGLSYGEVAETLGIPVGTVKSRVHHALRRLRETLDRREAR